MSHLLASKADELTVCDISERLALEVAERLGCEARREDACSLTLPAASRAPMIVMPEMAFEPDMSGVCSVGGTLVMTSNPTKIARMKTVSNMTSISPALLGLPGAP